jgi:hypothetical protein
MGAARPVSGAWQFLQRSAAGIIPIILLPRRRR